MKYLFCIIAILIAALWIGLNLHQGSGVLIIAIAGWRIDFPLWLGVLVLVLAYIVLHYTLKVLFGIFNISIYLKKLTQYYFKKRAKQATQKGLIALGEGHWRQSIRYLLKGIQDAEMPWVNYLAAAKAAQELGDERERDNYFTLAQKTKPEANFALSLMQAELQFRHKEYAQCLATLAPLKQKAPHQPKLLKLLQESYLQLKEWDLLLALLPKLKQYHILSPSALKNLELTVWKKIVLAEQKKQPLSTLDLWQSIPKNVRLEGEIPYLYAKDLICSGKMEEAENLLRMAIKQQWREDLVQLYGHLIHSAPQKLLATAEGWLNAHPDSAPLLLTLGCLCEQQQLWGKAQRYLEASLSLKPQPETYAQLGNLLERMNKPEQSAQFYKKGLLLAVPVKIQKPLLLRAPDA